MGAHSKAGVDSAGVCAIRIGTAAAARGTALCTSYRIAIGLCRVGVCRKNRTFRTSKRVRKKSRPSLLPVVLLSTTPRQALVSVATSAEAVTTHRF
eukprot:5981685-Prymnesium_polylepis.1